MAIRLVLTRDASPAHLARDLGIARPTIARWVRDAVARSPYGDVLKRLHDEVGALRRENAALQRILAARGGGSGADRAPRPGGGRRPRAPEPRGE